MAGETSRTLYDRALESLVGGVNSPVRAEPEPYPEFIDRGEGASVVDVDGNRYLDFVMGYGPLLLGHDLPGPVEKAVHDAAQRGPMFGAPTEIEVELAEFISNHVPSVESCRFVNSGTEATSAVARLARGYTGRDKIVLVKGGYHGGHESFLVEGTPENPKPGSAGVPQAFAEHAIPVPFNDQTEMARVFEEYGDEIAGVLIEPILGNKGIVAPKAGFHEKLRNLCSEHGSLLIFDEVITGFRVGGLGGAQSDLDVTPDLTTFAKIIGGGFPVGAIGGRAEIMEHFTPNGDVFESGTFNGHPVSMAAGLETLKFCKENDVHEHVDRLGERLRSELTEIVREHAPAYTVVGSHSMFKLVFTRQAPEGWENHCESGCRQRRECDRFERCPKTGADVAEAETERWRRIFWPAMRDEGIWLTPNQFESQFISWAHDDADIDRALEAYESVLSG